MASLYIHIPYCVKKCSYCDFVSIPDDGSIDRYVEALCKEIALTAEAGLCAAPLFETVFIRRRHAIAS